MNGAASSGSSFGQFMVNQGPRYDRKSKKGKPRRENQVLSRKGIIRPDKRKKAHYF